MVEDAQIELTTGVAAAMDCLRTDGCECEAIALDSAETLRRHMALIFARYGEELRASAGQGYTPVFVKADPVLLSALLARQLPTLSEPLSKEMQSVRIVERDPVDWRKNCLKESKIIDGKALLASMFEEVRDPIAALRLRWPQLKNGENSAFYDFRSADDFLFVKVPTDKPWELPAYFGVASAGRLEPSREVAVFRHWYEKFGAQPMVVSGSSWVFHVERPVEHAKEAIELMLDHVAYCPALLRFSEERSFRDGWALNASRWVFSWPEQTDGARAALPAERGETPEASRETNVVPISL